MIQTEKKGSLPSIAHQPKSYYDQNSITKQVMKRARTLANLADLATAETSKVLKTDRPTVNHSMDKSLDSSVMKSVGEVETEEIKFKRFKRT